MRWSQLHVPTLREDPSDADAVSHKLLLRAGFIRQLMAGHYSLLPMAARVRNKIIAIIREEMDGIGAQEFLLPSMHPAEIWRRSGRWEKIGQEMFRLKDRKSADMALGVTHEEIFTVVAQELKSYRDVPQMWYQFQVKFRDEPRPKSGLIRVREFTMKDSYSFDIDDSGLDRSYQLHRGAYERIFKRLGIPAVPARASNGTMGGSDSLEYVCPSSAGEDDILNCPHCGYAANLEKATSALEPVVDGPGLAEPEQFDTPGVRSIEDLVEQYGVAASSQIKTLVYVVDGEPTLVLLLGDDSLVEQKLTDFTGATEIRAARPEEIQEALGAQPGSLGAVGVTDTPIVADESLRGRRDMTTGANKDDVHLRGVDVERDIAGVRWTSLRAVKAGEGCPECGSPLESFRAVEVGHIFKLGQVYTKPLDAAVLDNQSRRVPLTMGSYGIGVERSLACVVETHHDDKGMVWPVQLAPFEASVVVAQPKNEAVAQVGQELYDSLRKLGVDVVIDDRDERLGVKLRDTEITGIPFRVVVGARGLTDGVVEVTERATGEVTQVKIGDAAAQVAERVSVGLAAAKA
ncbi:proline--tRNA ligase [Streptomyces sp. NPDC001351]|uniref:proline--tRNA ligase n=1 Tax=Streptomyces sp. NPDC001351 TaxID=3364564 RepID=UPI0036B100A6